jgi:hypothetical protein
MASDTCRAWIFSLISRSAIVCKMAFFKMIGCISCVSIVSGKQDTSTVAAHDKLRYVHGKQSNHTHCLLAKSFLEMDVQKKGIRLMVGCVDPGQLVLPIPSVEITKARLPQAAIQVQLVGALDAVCIAAIGRDLEFGLKLQERKNRGSHRNNLRT